MPKISVIVPVYNVEPYLSRCIDSVLNQTFSDFELILIDDGSPDKCPKICDMYAVKDNRIHVIHQKNGGLSAARNAGIDWVFKNSDSEFLTFIDSDDWVCEQYLEFLYSTHLKTGLNVVIGGYERVSGSAAETEFELNEEVCDTERFYSNHRINSITAWGKLAKKTLYSDVRFPVGKLHEDEFTTYKILFMNEQVAYIKEPLYKYFFAENSIMNSEWTPKRLVVFQAFEEQLLYFRKHGYKKAYALTARKYFSILLESIEKLKSLQGDNSKLLNELERKYRRGLWKYGIRGEYRPTEKTGKLYKLIFLICVVWKKNFLKKISNFSELFKK